MGDGDRVIRVLVGALLIGYIMGVDVDKLGWLSLLPLLAIPVVMTAILSWDPIYGLFNINTAKKIPMTTLGFMATNVGKVDTTKPKKTNKERQARRKANDDISKRRLELKRVKTLKELKDAIDTFNSSEALQIKAEGKPLKKPLRIN